METIAIDRDLTTKLQRLRANLAEVVRGKQEVIDKIVIALLAGGSVLIEDVPGVGKTTLAKALAASVDVTFQRIQCTPDLLPSDVLGFSVFQPQDGSFHFRKGPVFCNVLLVDEINRASPRTQSALLEAMAEGQVTVEGTRYELESPFIVIATQNPLGFQGTFPLPEAQLDRFLFQLAMDYPDAESEVEMLFQQSGSHPLAELAHVMSGSDILEAQQAVHRIHVERCVAEYIVEIVRKTRDDSRLRLGCSPRGSLLLFTAARAAAMMSGRKYVLPDDVQVVAKDVLAHRVVAHDPVDDPMTLRLDVVQDIIAGIDVPL